MHKISAILVRLLSFIMHNRLILYLERGHKYIMKSRKDVIIQDNNNIQPVYMNGMRIGLSEEAIQIEFASIQDNDSGEQVVHVQSKVRMSPTALKGVIERLVSAGVVYEKKYNKDLGIGKFLKNREGEKGEQE